MKWLFVPLLWVLAAFITVAVLWRMYRGKNIVLRGKWSPRIIRMVAILLVVLGVGLDRTPAAPVTPPPTDKSKTDGKGDELPAAVKQDSIRQWMMNQVGGYGRGDNYWLHFKQAMTNPQVVPGERELTPLTQFGRGMPPKLAAMFKADLDAIAAKKDTPRLDARSMLAIYDEIEERGYYDHWLNAYLWRKTALSNADDTKLLAELYARMYRHSRLTDTLIRAHGEVKPYTVSARAWMSKGGPRPEDRNLEAKGLSDMYEAAKKIYPAMDGGTWKRDGVVMFTVGKDSPPPVLVRGGRRQALPSGAQLKFGRLDLIETPPGDKAVSLRHPWLGTVTLPPNRTIAVWQLSGLMSDAGQKSLNKIVQEALDGDEDTADSLELTLPLAHAVIRAAVKESPKAKLAPRLRMMLSLFDDAVMPALGVPRVDSPFGP